MKTNYLLKIFYFLLMLTGINLAYADKLSFDFIYGESITSVNYVYSEDDDYAVDIDKYAPPFAVTPVASTDKYTIQVNTEITNSGSSGIASEFNLIDNYLPNYNDSYVMEVGGAESKASSLDFWMLGNLYINGDLVDTRFTIAHNNHNNSIAANDWWISAPSYTSRYESYGIVRIDLHSIDSNGNNTGRNYCLTQNSTNYQVMVTYGACSNLPPPPSPKETLAFEWSVVGFTSSHVANVTFNYNGTHDDMHNSQDYLESVTSEFVDDGFNTDVDVYSALNLSTDIASSFTNLFASQQHFMSPNSSGASNPSALDYYVQGTLTITGENSNYPTVTIPDFTAAYDQDGNIFWVGTNYGLVVGKGKMSAYGYCLSFNNYNMLNVTYGGC